MRAVYQWLWHLIPGNPMVVRIVQGGSQRTRDLWVRMGYLGALVLLMLIGLLQGGSALAGEVSLTELAKNGTKVFAIISYGQIILVCLLSPLFMAGAIGQERAGQTYNILLTTPLSNLQIVLGSLFGRLFFILALILAGLPLFAVLLIFGGVPVWSVVVSFTTAACTVFVVGTVAVTMSVFRAGGRKAVFCFVIVIAAYLIGAYLLDIGLFRKLGPPKTTTWLTALHPLLVLEASLNSANYRPSAPETLADSAGWVRFYLGRPFAAFATITTLISLVQIVIGALVLRRMGQGEWVFIRWTKAQLRLPVESGGERRRPARDVWANPIAWREAATRGRGVAAFFARAGFTVIGILLGATLIFLHHIDMLPKLPGASSAEVFQQALFAVLLIEVAIITLVALYMSAGCVSREREDGTLDLLLTTPTTPRQYIWGKLRGLVSFLSLMLSAPILTVAMVSIYALIGKGLEWDQATVRVSAVGSYQGATLVTRHPMLMLPEAAVLFALMLVPFVAVCVMIGMYFSVRAKGVLGAVVPSVAIVGGASLVLAFCGVSAASSVPFVGPVLNSLSPATNLLMIVNPWENVANFIEQPGPGRISLVIASLISAGAYAGFVWVMLSSMVKGFDHTVRRLSGTG